MAAAQFPVPAIAFVVFEATFLEQVAAFVLTGPRAMVFLLRVGVMEQRFLLDHAHREDTVIELPVKAVEGRVLLLQPLAGGGIASLTQTATDKSAWKPQRPES